MFIVPRRSAVCIALLVTLLMPVTLFAYEVAPRTGFPVTLPGARVGFGSPTLAELTGDGKPEIIVGGIDGIVHAVQGNGQIVWSFNLSPVINNAARAAGLVASTKPVPIRTAPSVADLTGDGRPEVVVAAGEVFEDKTHGGVVVLDANGQILPGWPQLFRDMGGNGADLGSADGYADGSVSTPALGDITGDGKPEIVYGGFDQQVYARRIDGSLVPGWPQWVLDTVWSSPALADLDRNGTLDVIIGVDAHTYCCQPRATEIGGDLYAFRGDGSIMWRAHQDEIFQSSPAVGDLDGDGWLEIVAGTGTYYSASGQANGRYISAWNHNGTLRWRTPLSDRAPGAPALGDLNGDGKLDIAIGTMDARVHALQGSTGTPLWSTAVLGLFGTKYGTSPVYSPIMGDYDGNGVNDVFIANGWEVTVLNGASGQQFTANGSDNSTKPSYYTSYTIAGTPALGDVDGDGKLDLVAASGATNEDRGRIFMWRLPNSTTTASWPMLRGNPQHTGTLGTTTRVNLPPQMYVPVAKR